MSCKECEEWKSKFEFYSEWVTRLIGEGMGLRRSIQKMATIKREREKDLKVEN